MFALDQSSRRQVVLGLILVLLVPTLTLAEGFSWWPKKKVDTTKRAEPFEQQAHRQSERPVASPALGQNGNPEPGRIRRFKDSVVDKTKSTTNRMTGAVKRGAKKTGAAFQSEKKSEADPLAIATPTKTPDAGFYIAVAQMQERAGNLPGADENYRKALELEPKNLQALLDYAHLHDRQGQLEEATALYRTAVKHHPDSARAYNDLGICLARQELLLDAQEALNEAVRIEPERKLYRNNLAKVLVKSNRPQEAYAQLAQAHAPAIAHYNMGYLLYEQSNLPGAEYHFNQAAAADPQFVAARQWCDRLAVQLRGSTVPGQGHPSLAQRPAQPPHAPVAPAAPASPAPPMYAPAGEDINIALPPGAGGQR